MSEDKAAKGKAMIKQLFGAMPENLPFPPRFRAHTVEHLFGDVWQGEGLPLQERSLVTCAVLTAPAREPEQRIHFTGAKNIGVPREKLEEMIIHVAYYAGWPVTVGALRVLEEIWPADE